MANSFDLIVLGAGNAGQAAASAAKADGQSVLLIETRDVGGTCPLRGCVPKKVLVAASEVMASIELASEHHINVPEAKLDWPALMKRERGFVEGVADSFEQGVLNKGIELIKGEASFVNENTVTVNGDEFQGKKIVIATGSTPRNIPLPGFEHAVTSDDLLELAELPESLVFIGGGVIALELGQVFARAGTKVTILEVMPQLLPRLEPEVIDVLTQETRRIGIEVHTGVKVHSIERFSGENGDEYQVAYSKDDVEFTATTALVANGAGRVANVQNLNLSAANVETDERGGILVDEHLRSRSNNNVFIAGDALVTSAQLSPVATYEGRIVGHNLTNDSLQSVDYRYIPSAVYTVPTVATVGMTEYEAKEKGLDFEVKLNDMQSWRSSMTYAEKAVFSKTLIEKGTDKILGATIIGHGSQEIIHFIALGMKTGQTATDLKNFVYAYPTFTSDVKFLF